MKRALALALALIGTRDATADEPVVPEPTPDPAPPPELPVGEEAQPVEPTPSPEPEHDDDEMRDKPALRHFSRREIVVNVPGERKRDTVLLLSGLAGGGALVGAIGLYFHLDSRSASDEVSASRFTGRAWTPENQALVDQAASSRTKAAVFYGVGTALVTAAIVGLIVTEPAMERHVIRPHVGVAPIPGGAIAGGGFAW